MKNNQPADLAASVHQRLLNISKKTGVDPNLIWTRYATERLLYRLACSEYKDQFVLKGAMLFFVWTGEAYRPTYDLDLLGLGEVSEERIAATFRNLCDVPTEPDGLVFDAHSVRVEPIREAQEYLGERVTLVALLGKGRIPLQIDIGFGDVVNPAAEKITFPTLLDFPAPHIRAYRRETVVAEKLQAMTTLGMANSRMKDFYDLYILSRDFAFDGATLAKAIEATFKRRGTPIPTSPLCLSDEFASDRVKITQWNAFLRKNSLEMPILADIVAHIRSFLGPVVDALVNARKFSSKWPGGGPWQTARR